MKNSKKLLKRNLKAIYGGSAPQCPNGYKPCLTGIDDNENPKWACIPGNLVCSFTS
ncbi:hypothetical protein ODZ84_01095 [Chryseobacterium fluminis]|uniref:hypothetical protein n=1 Tax=Chryseobacterium fluminis TaxID=2983606 RepID=UPI002258B5CA|nr:hypothetical protein [Chryseobacterium sp. MMS21-Ot14]UZT98198.1 hypothetical protein ODZ84_01095 [Chryseobacterium sp. MMS21-Ot14]